MKALVWPIIAGSGQEAVGRLSTEKVRSGRQVFDLFASADASLPLILLLLAILGFRARVTPTARVLVRAPANQVFEHLDFRDGLRHGWHGSAAAIESVDEAKQLYRMRFTTTLPSGQTRASEAFFRVLEKQRPHRIVVERAGLEGRAHNNELLKITADLQPGTGGTDVKLTYHWGPRPLIAQLLARTDLWSSIYRLKGVAETGKPDLNTERLITAGVALGTGLLSLAAFGWWFGWFAAIILVVALFVHEFGHLLAFRLIGQPWGRMVFLPFLGALAMPRLSFHTQAESVFSALMGPGLSLIIPGATVLAMWAGWDTGLLLVKIALVTAVLNLFNLLPVEPLDGGVALRSIFARLLGRHLHYGLASVGLLILAAGWFVREPLLFIFGGLSIAANLRPRHIDKGLVPLTTLQVAISLFGFAAIAAAYVTALGVLMVRIGAG